jgi:hypothetical protein
MWGTHGARGHNRPLRIIPERGKGPEYIAHSPRKQRCDVLHEDVSGSHLANDSGKLPPEAGSFAVESGALSRVADVLAGEAPADEIDRLEVVASDIANVLQLGNVGPVLRQHALAERVNLDLPPYFHPGALQAEFHATDTSEQ